MKQILFPAVLMLGLAAAGCSRDDNNNDNTAGAGGPTSLRISVRHHTATIDSGRVRIKYNASSQPAEGTYDDSVFISKLTNQTAQAVIPSLKAGRYYLSAIAYDNNVVPGKATLVVGGIPYTIADTMVGRNVILPVTEPGDPL